MLLTFSVVLVVSVASEQEEQVVDLRYLYRFCSTNTCYLTSIWADSNIGHEQLGTTA